MKLSKTTETVLLNRHFVRNTELGIRNHVITNGDCLLVEELFRWFLQMPTHNQRERKRCRELLPYIDTPVGRVENL